MKIHSFATIALFLLSATGFSQTKKIAFESHSGDMKNFNIALNNALFDNGESDFGLPANKSAYKLDSVIFISDTVSVLVSKEYSRPFQATTDSLDKFVRIKKDTVYNDPLFSRKSLRNIIGKMSDERGYETTTKTTFVGFDNKKNKAKPKEEKPQQQFVPFPVTNDPPDNDSPFDSKLLLMLGAIFCLSLAGGWLTWKFYKPRLQSV